MRELLPISSISTSIRRMTDNEFSSADITEIISNGHYRAVNKEGQPVNLRSNILDLNVGSTVRFRNNSLVVTDVLVSSPVVTFFI